MKSKWINAGFTVSLIVLTLIFTMRDGHSAENSLLCKELKKISRTGKLEKFSVPYKSNATDEINYEVDFKKNDSRHIPAILKASCGASTGAECSWSIVASGEESRTFSTTNNFRLIHYKGSYFLVWGVSIDRKHSVSIQDFTVEKVTASNNLEICK